MLKFKPFYRKNFLNSFWDESKFLFKNEFSPSWMRLLNSKWKVAKRGIQVDFFFSNFFKLEIKNAYFVSSVLDLLIPLVLFVPLKNYFQNNLNHLKKLIKEKSILGLGQRISLSFKTCNSFHLSCNLHFLIFQNFVLIQLGLNLCIQANGNIFLALKHLFIRGWECTN